MRDWLLILIPVAVVVYFFLDPVTHRHGVNDEGASMPNAPRQVTERMVSPAGYLLGLNRKGIDLIQQKTKKGSIIGGCRS